MSGQQQYTEPRIQRYLEINRGLTEEEIQRYRAFKFIVVFDKSTNTTVVFNRKAIEEKNPYALSRAICIVRWTEYEEAKELWDAVIKAAGVGRWTRLFRKKETEMRIALQKLTGDENDMVRDAARKVLRGMMKFTGPPVLLYHDVVVKTKRSRYDILYEDLAYQLKDVHDRGLHTITATELVEAAKKGKPLPKTIVLTFDDGYASFYYKVFPLLKKYGIKATVFIVTGDVGKKGYMTWEQIKEIGDSGLVEIGSHSVSHRNLANMDEKSIMEELRKSKEEIEKHIGKKVRVFAWPYGEAPLNAEKLVKKAGYDGAFRSFAPRGGDNPYGLNRTSTGGEQSRIIYEEARNTALKKA
ncbi:MAG: polysaccharide deacetylase family protein [Candidatus Micrarchaeia archaeon]